MTDLIELDALLDLLDNKKDAHIKRAAELMEWSTGQDDLERSIRHSFTAIQLDKIIDEVLNLPRY